MPDNAAKDNGPSVNQSGKRVIVTPDERERRETRRRAALWAAVWECSQTMSADEIRGLVEGTLREIENDAP
jgi:hypothetical protein